MFYDGIFLEDMEDIIQLMKEDCQGEVDSWLDKGRLFVRGTNGQNENELMLRFNSFYGKAHGYEYLRIEMALTSAMKQFALKHGFESIPHVKSDYIKRI